MVSISRTLSLDVEKRARHGGIMKRGREKEGKAEEEQSRA
jgi:hypothetical protein